MPRPGRESAVIVAVPQAEPAVGELRLRHTYDAPLGLPPHVTLLYPFVPPAELTEDVEERLARLIAAAPAFDVVFAARRAGRSSSTSSRIRPSRSRD